MLEQKALAYANMYGVLGTLENLCELDSKAKEILKEIKNPVSVCFDVKDGPCRTFNFDADGCRDTGDGSMHRDTAGMDTGDMDTGDGSMC